MHQNAQICKLNFKNFLGAMPPDPIAGRDYSAPPRPNPSALRCFAPTTPCSGPSAPPSSPTRNPGSTPGRTTVWKSWLRLCAWTICYIKWGHPFRKKLGARPPPHPPHRNPGSATVPKHLKYCNTHAFNWDAKRLMITTYFLERK